MRDPQAPEPSFIPASLAAAQVGIWDYDVIHDRLRYCRNFAALYGLPPGRGGEGVSMERLVAVTHPDDRAKGHAKRAHLFRHGGAFVYEHRAGPSPSSMHWLLVRGFYEAGEGGRIIRGRGIAIDVTEGKQDGFADGDVFFVTEADDKEVSALDRATKHVLAARRALDELNPESASRLRPAADVLLLEIARHIAGTIIPVTSSKTEH